MKRLYVAIALFGAVVMLSLGTTALGGKLDGLYRAAENHHFAPVPKTGLTYDDPFIINDDGELQRGIPWPAHRFTDNGDGTVSDNLTSLVWMKEANRFGQQNWYDACTACGDLGEDGAALTDGSQVGDWRLPNLKELQSLIDYGIGYPALPVGHPFKGALSNYYWSSTTPPYRTDVAWLVLFTSGHVFNLDKGNTYYVWCVRDRK